MKIKKISIDGVGGIQHLDLDFNEGLNLICGSNGIGKTTILECIGNAFSSQDSGILKRNASYAKGVIQIQYEKNEKVINASYEVNEFEAQKKSNGVYSSYISGCKYEDSPLLLVFKTHRSIEYSPMDAVKKDKTVTDIMLGQEASAGVNSTDIKSWLINRKLFSSQEIGLNEIQLENLKLALNILGSLDENIKFSRIIPDTLDIMLNTPKGEIYLEYLSSGYKSCFYILLGIIKEIEFRFKNPYMLVKEFNGVILIDEIDLHLHPEWQAKLIKVLKYILPKAQIIATTHSPHMIQAVLPNEIIPLAIDYENNIYKKELNLSKYGLQGWSVEEILEDVMGLKSTSSDLYNEIIEGFDTSMDNDDMEKANEYYKKLKSMLHPNNTLRRILDIQMAGVKK